MITGKKPDCAFTDHVLQTGQHGICNDIEHDPGSVFWRKAALQRGYHAMASLPLKVDGALFGTFNLYAAEPGFFDDDEMRLLDELATDIGFALEVRQRETERRRAQDELRWKTAFFEAQVDSALDGIVVVDQQGKKIIQNRRLNELFKIPREIADDPDDARQVAFVTAQVKNPGPFTEKVIELYSSPERISRDVVELLDGTVLDRTSSPVRDKAGNYYGRIWTFRDITEHRRLEEQLRQSQKLEAVGQLAGGIAHDFNNILTVIQGYGSLLMATDQLGADDHEAAQQIVRAAERAGALTRQLLAFSRRQVLQTRLLDLNDIVTSLTKMLQRVLGEDVRLHLDLHPRPLRIRADAGMLDQVLLNLVVNARDAMPRGGRLNIETDEKTLTRQDCAALPDTSPGRYVRLRVTDTGDGIAPENMSKIFEPFFTTKEPGKGTGLGLATVFGIVRQHNGTVLVESAVAHGTTFTVLLPADDSMPEIFPDDGAKVAPRGGSETILVVEDEPSVRLLTRVVLERGGYRVFEATNGPEALQVWAEAAGGINLLLTDIVMPEGLSGRELAARLGVQRPGLKVIFTSGYSADIAGRELNLHDGQNFIQKPASPQQLLEVVRRALDS